MDSLSSMGKCANCGKDILVRDIRDKKSQFCNRVCGNALRYMKRYRGTGSGPLDRPSVQKKMTEF